MNQKTKTPIEISILLNLFKETIKFAIWKKRIKKEK